MAIHLREAWLPDDADGLARVYVSSTEHHIALDPERYLRRRPGPASMLAEVPTASLDVAVLPEHRGQALGRRLIEAAAAVARNLGVSRVRLDAHHANDGARRLYRDLGYRPMGVLLSMDL